MRSLLQRALLRNNSRLFVRVNTFLSLVTIFSIFSISLETVEQLTAYESIFSTIEFCVVLIFTLEYLGRIIAKEDRKEYIFSFFGIVDLIAILPTYIGLANLSFLKSTRIVRVLQFLRTLRLAKVAKLPKNSNRNSKKSLEIQFISVRIYGLVLFSAVVFFGTALYFFEGQNPLFVDIPSSSYWVALTILGGSVDTSSFSLFAKVMVLLIQFCGLLLFGLLIHLVGRYFERKILGSSSIKS